MPADDPATVGDRAAARWPAVFRWAVRLRWWPALAWIGFGTAISVAGLSDDSLLWSAWWPVLVATMVIGTWSRVRLRHRGRWWPFLTSVTLLLASVSLNVSGPAWIEGLWSLTSVFALVLGIRSGAQLRRHRRRRKEYEHKIEELKERGELTPEDIEAEVIGTARSSRPAAERALIADLVSSSFLDSPEFRAVERYVADHPARLPREGKRIFNHAQLVTEIARGRGMFGGDPRLTPEHLAKWLVLSERWPAIRRAVLDDPDVLVVLEDAAATGELAPQLEAPALHANDVEQLAALLCEAPLLGAVIERLIHFKPATAGSAPAGGSSFDGGPAATRDQALERTSHEYLSADA